MPDLLKILLIDDNPDDRLLIIRELKKLFVIDVEEIIDNKGFLNSLSRLDFDIIITDYQLRWTTGIEVLIKIKSVNPLIPVIMFTGTGSEEIAVMAMKIGLDDYILKSPLHYNRLALSVKSAILRMHDDMLRKKAENALRKSEENYRMLVENIGIGFARIDRDFNILMVNEAMAKMFKREPHELIGMKCYELYNQSMTEMPCIQELSQQSLKLPGENLMLGLCADKSTFDALVRTFPTFNEKGEITGYTGITEDISGKLRSERIQEVIFNITSAVITTESLNQFLSVISNELARITNTFEMQVVLVSELGNDNHQVLYAPDNGQYSEKRLEGNTLAGIVIGKGSSLLLMHSEIENMKTAGEIDSASEGIKVWMGIPLKGHGNIMGALVLQNYESENAFSNEDLDILQFVSNQIAIAIENKRSTDNLRESEMRFRNLVEQSADGVMIINHNGSIIEWNPAMTRILLIPRQEAIGKKILDLHIELCGVIHKDMDLIAQLNAKYQEMKKLLSKQESIVDKTRIKLRNGESRYIELSIFQLKFRGELNTGAFVKDITDLRDI